jgi:hypothetical protein
LEKKISGKNYRGRPKMEYIGEIMKSLKTKIDKQKRIVRMKRLAENREDWRAATNQSLD